MAFREESTVNRDSSASIEFFSAREQRPSLAQASPTKPANWRSTLNNPLYNVRQTTGLNPIQEGYEEGGGNGSIVSMRSTEIDHSYRESVVSRVTENNQNE